MKVGLLIPELINVDTVVEEMVLIVVD